MKTAKLRFELIGGNLMLSKLTDIESGLVIPITGIKIDLSVEKWKDGVYATVALPIDEIEIVDTPILLEQGSVE